MNKLQIYVCENFYPEYKEVIDRERFDEVELHVFPDICDHKGRKNSVREMLSYASHKNSILVCSNLCDARNLLPEDTQIDVETTNYCFSHLICDEFIDYLTAKGSYIISTGWLNKWKEHINAMGFDKYTARNFFQETSKQIVFLDAKIEENAENYLKELSSYIGLPYIIIPIELEALRLILKSKVYEWRLRKKEEKSSAMINELRSQCAEYSAVFDMLGKISTFTGKREVIGKIKELFFMVFGAQEFNFWGAGSNFTPSELESFKSSEDSYIIFRDENRFCIKVTWDDALYGIIDASGFMFPQYIDKYFNLAIEVAKFCGLVLHNNEQYQIIVESEKELKYLSYHDSMTGLYNRTYVNQVLADKAKDKETIVFMFDIDKLKYVNDNYGHSEGDKLIERFASVLKNCFREEDIVARIGGDEFLAIMHESSEEIAESIKQRIFDSIKVDNQKVSDNNLKLNVSIGYSVKENNDDTIEDLMKKADELMYEDKLSKR